MGVWRRVVARRVQTMFADLSRGEHERVIAALAPDVHHSFAGEHALGGERHDRPAVAAWFGRLSRLCPDMRFVVRDVLSSGPPWDLRVGVEWVAHVRPAAGPAYENHGAHMIRIVRGRVSELHAYEDSQLVAAACARMAAAGIDEAAAEPITS